MKKFLFGFTKASLFLISLLPFWLLYLLSDLFFFLIYRVFRYRREVVRTNLKNSFPEKCEAELNSIEKKYYQFLADQILETVKMQSMSEASIKKRFRLNNPEEIHKHFDQGRSVLAVTGHYCNWEWGSLIVTVSYKQPVIIVYKPLSDKYFEGLMNGMRSKFGAVMVSMKQTLRKIIEYKSSRFVAVLVGDQTPARDESRYFTSFLNQPTPVFLGVEKIARLTNNPVVYCHLNLVKRGYYECTFKTLFAEPKNTREYEITNGHTAELERVIRSRPELWLWSHKRWKYKPEDFLK